MSSVSEAEPLFTIPAPAVQVNPRGGGKIRIHAGSTIPIVARQRRLIITLAVFFALSSASRLHALPVVSAAGTEDLPMGITARSAILIDQATGRVLFERNADEPMIPASLTKLMTLHLVYERLEERTISLSDVVTISLNAWGLNQAPGSSLMNLEPGQIVTVEELMKGMAVASGNDAATALAEYVGGSTEKFVRLMNEECRWMGYKSMHFTDPAGVKETNVVTAREFADFCRRYIELHPQSLVDLLSLREFEYPQPWNLPDGWPDSRKLSVKPIKQYNGNFLVWNGIDGLKTGHLDENNFTAAITIKNGDTRLIAVILGVSGRTLAEGYRQRAKDAMALLSYGLRTFTTVSPDIPPLRPLRVWQGSEEYVPIVSTKPLLATVRRSEEDKISYSVVVPPSVVAPVKRGQKVGDLVFFFDSGEVGRYDLLADRDVEAAGIFKRVWDAVLMNVSTLFGGVG